MKKIKYCLLALLCPLLSMAQVLKPALDIGDAMPDFTITNVMNSPKNTLKFSDFKSKLVILDFWATWCKACFTQFPRLEVIQKKFDSQLQILLVNTASTGDNEQKISSLLKKGKTLIDDRLPIIVNDTILDSWFPRKIIPHYVWIKEGVVMAITGSEEVTENNIESILQNKPVNFISKIDLTDFNKNQSLYKLGGVIDKHLMYQSLITRNIPGIASSGGSTLDSINSTLRIYFLNLPLLNIYQNAIGTRFDSRLFLDVPDQSIYLMPDENKKIWARDNSYCYELRVPSGTSKDKYTALIVEDLNRYFGLNGRMEIKKIRCLALTRISESCNQFATKGGIAVSPPGNTQSINLFNQPISQLIYLLNNRLPAGPLKPIVINETGYKGNVDLELPFFDNNLPAFNNYLKKYGLVLKEVERTLTVFMLTAN